MQILAHGCLSNSVSDGSREDRIILTPEESSSSACSSAAHLDNGGDELKQEALDFEQGGVEVVQEVHDEPLDVGAIMVLIRHDHQVPVAQLLRAVIALQLQTHTKLECPGCSPQSTTAHGILQSTPCIHDVK